MGRAAFVQLNLNSSNGGSVRELEFKIDLADENAVLEETRNARRPVVLETCGLQMMEAAADGMNTTRIPSTIG